MYCTALSAEDILDLYHTPASVDNLGNAHAFEFVEKQGNLFAGSFLGGSISYDNQNGYYVITSSPSTST
jgi:hypothetical protein